MRRSTTSGKLRPPALPRGFVSRPTLLAHAQSARFCLVVAPGGFGKTCLLTELASESSPVAWYTMRAEDADPATLALGLGEALVAVASAKAAKPLLDALALSGNVEPVATACMLLKLAEGVQGSFRLILDDVHVISGASDSLALLDRFLFDLPDGASIAVGSRSAITLPALTRARAAGHLAEITSDELRLGSDEAEEVLKEHQLEANLIDEVTRRCGGWPALVKLAGTLVGRDRSALSNLAGSEEVLYRYIASELFESLGEEDRRFLLKTAACASFTADMADFLLGSASASLIRRASAGGWLQRIQSAGGVTYSYHPLLAGFLKERLSADGSNPEERMTLERSGDWMAGHERWDEAFGYWQEAGRTDKVVDQLAAWEVGLVEYWPLYGRWLHSLSKLDLKDKPRLIFRRALGHLFSGDVKTAFDWQDFGEDAARESGSAEWIIDSEINRGHMNYFARNLEVAESKLETLRAKEDDLLPRQKLLVYSGLVLIEMDRCRDFGRATEYVDKVIQLSNETQHWRALGVALANLAFIKRLKGDYEGLVRLVEANSLPHLGGAPLLPRTYQLMAMGLRAVDLGLDEGVELLTEATRLADLANYHWIGAGMRLSLAVFYLERGQLSEAEAMIEECAKTPSTHAGITVGLQITRGLLAAKKGDSDGAKLHFGKPSEPVFLTTGAYDSVVVHGLLLIDEHAAARELAANTVREARTRGMRFVEATALFMLSAAGGAGSSDLARLIELVRQGGYEEIFFSRWPGIAPQVLSQAIGFGREPEYVHRLASRLDPNVLRVSFFGGLRVWRGTLELQDSDWERPKSRALFAYLLLQNEQPVHAETIAEIFWPDLELSAAKNSLRVAVTRVRKAIGANDTGLVFENEQYRLAPADCWQDRSSFEMLAGLGLEMETPDQATEMLTSGLDLFNGDFLPEFRFEDWAAAERERLEAIRRRARLRLAKHLIALGRAEAALPYVEAAADADVLDEAAARAKMTVLGALDRYDEARRAFAKLQTELRTQLNTDPSEATQQLAQDLRLIAR